MDATGHEPAVLRDVDSHPGGVGWIAHPEEHLQRASHALVEDGDVWLVDPVDVDGLDAFLAERGEVAGVVVLLDRHERDAAAIARRHDVAVHLPPGLAASAGAFDAPVAPFRGELADTGYVAHSLIDRLGWHEAVLYSEDRDVLVVPEAVGTVGYYRVPGERLGVHPLLRFRPPRSLTRFAPTHLLVGHGAGIHEDAAGVLADAVGGARRGLPRLYWQNARALAPW